MNRKDAGEMYRDVHSGNEENVKKSLTLQEKLVSSWTVKSSKESLSYAKQKLPLW
jgi:hypothetical protein